MKKVKEMISLFLSRHTLGQKFNYLNYSLSKKSKILSYKPITISVVSTGRCTLSCDMCPTHSKIIPDDYPYIQNPTQDISFETFKKVVDKFSKALNVQIIGSGEPLLNKDFFKMVEYAVQTKRMKVKTFSNGTTIEKNIDKIIGSSLDGLTISLNSHSAEDFSRMTGCSPHVFSKIYSAIEKLIQARNGLDSQVKIKISFIIDKINYKHIPEMISIGEKLGADFLFLCNFLPSPYDGFRAEERMLFFDDMDVVKTMKAAYQSLSKELRNRVSFPKLVKRNSLENKCTSHHTQIRVDGEGRISSCSIMLLNMDGHGYFYDKNVWNNQFFQDMRQIFISGNKDDLMAPCRICPENFGVDFDE